MHERTIQQRKEVTEGQIVEGLPDTTFRVRLLNGYEVLGYLSGKMRLHYIRVLPGDKVAIELSPDGKRGRIVRRF